MPTRPQNIQLRTRCSVSCGVLESFEEQDSVGNYMPWQNHSGENILK